MLLEYATAAVMLAVCCFVPLYVSNGYYNIGEDKYAAFRQCMIWGMPVLCLLFIVYLIWNSKELQRPQMSATDIFVVLFLLAVCLSVVCGGFLPNALKGYPGWYMGLLSQVCFALIYLFTSRFGKKYISIICILMCVAFFVFGIAVLNRFVVDPLGYYKGLDQIYIDIFVSTLGQTSWYASFWAVVLPIGMAAVVFTHNKIIKVLSIVFVGIAMASLVTVNAEAGYFAFVAMMVLLGILAFESVQSFLWFAVLWTEFLTVSRIARIVMLQHPEIHIKLDTISRLILQYDQSWWTVLGCSALVVLLLGYCAQKGLWFRKSIRKVQWGLAVGCLCVIVLFTVLIVANTKGILPQDLTEKLKAIGYFSWNELWGNGRGKTWTFSAQMYHNYPLINKLFGVGPDCYYDYASRHYAQRLYEMWGNQALTNAHNEWLNMLITTGLFGAACYIGIFVSALKTFLQKENRNWFTIAVAGSIVSYMAYNFFCYQQVLCTPFIFMLMGFGMYVVSHGKDASKTCN